MKTLRYWIWKNYFKQVRILWLWQRAGYSKLFLTILAAGIFQAIFGWITIILLPIWVLAAFQVWLTFNIPFKKIKIFFVQLFPFTEKELSDFKTLRK